MSAVEAPRFGRYRCVNCRCVVPWRWLTEEPRRAHAAVDAATGNVCVLCEKCVQKINGLPNDKQETA